MFIAKIHDIIQQNSKTKMLAHRIFARTTLRTFRSGLSRARFSMQAGTSSYEGDGKTTVSILNQEVDAGLMINSFSQMGFRLNNGMMVIGPMAIFPK